MYYLYDKASGMNLGEYTVKGGIRPKNTTKKKPPHSSSVMHEGSWVASVPVVAVKQEYRVTLITKTEWRDLLTIQEQVLSDKVKGSIEGNLVYLTDVDEDSLLVPGITNRDILRTGYTAFGDAESLEVTNPTVQLVTQTMFVVGILATQERVDTILLGVPL